MSTSLGANRSAPYNGPVAATGFFPVPCFTHKSRPRIGRVLLTCAGLGGLLWFVQGCAATPDPPTTPTPDSAVTPDATAGPEPQSIQLRFWTLPEFSQGAGDGDELATALAAFERLTPNVSVTVEVKDPYGAAAVLPFLTATARVAPSSMPDVAVVPLGLVEEAASAGVVRTISSEDLTSRTGEAYGFARRMATVESQIVAVPFAVDVVHAIGRDGPPPTTWSEALESGPFVIPVGGAQPPATAAFLSLFTSAGGDPAAFDEPDTVAQGPLENTLGFLQAAQDQGRLTLDEAPESPAESWNSFLTRDLRWAAVAGGLFLRQEGGFPGFSHGRLPGQSQPAPTVAWGWAFVLPNLDPARAQQAAELVAWLTGPEQRTWIWASGHLPAWPSPGDDWTGGHGREYEASDDYLGFLRGALNDALGVATDTAWTEGFTTVLRALSDNAASDTAPGADSAP